MMFLSVCFIRWKDFSRTFSVPSRMIEIYASTLFNLTVLSSRPISVTTIIHRDPSQ